MKETMQHGAGSSRLEIPLCGATSASKAEDHGIDLGKHMNIAGMK